MPPAETSHVLELIRRLGGQPPGGDDERAICDFLRRAAESRLPSSVAAELAWVIAESGASLPTRRFSPLTSVHSTGAPGSLSTLLSPVLAASCGVYVPLVSVRGSAAGAIDSLATLPGYNVSLGAEDFLRVLATARLAHIGHSPNFAPADRTLWELRGRVEGAKEAPTLIAASLLGKKLAAGAYCGSIDVRVGPAGNAGDTAEAALETAWAIVSAARHLGMRVSCVLSDASRLPWPQVGRLDALLSLWEVLTDEAWHDHTHVRLCREVAVAACHAANPLVDLPTWRERVAQALRSGQARATFEASIEGHGAQPDGVEQVRRQAAARTDVPVSLEGEPEPRSVSAFFKAARGRMRPEAADAIGLSWRQEEHLFVVHVPTGEDEATIRELAASVRPVGEGTPPITQNVIRFGWEIGPVLL